MRSIRLFISLLVLAIATAGCRPTPGADMTEVPPGAVVLGVHAFPDEVTRHFFSGIPERERLVVQDAAEWAVLWSRITADVAPQPPAPAVDFSAEIVVVAAMGQRMSGGFAIHLDTVYERADRLYAVVREVSPGDDCFVTAALTAPVTAVRVPRRGLPVTFVERTEVRRCD